MQYRTVAADAFSAQRQLLWDLCYRITGSVGDADMLLRESFARVIERPLVREGDWRPHLVRSAATLAMEALRNRKRRSYAGAWLPSPVETDNAASTGPRPDAASGVRYDMVESGTMAFLRALEALDPRERVVFVLSDAFGFAPQDAAAALDLTITTVRTVLQNGRRKMHHYDAANVPPTARAQADVAAVLRDFLVHLQAYDASRLEKILALDAQATFDAGGEFVAPSAHVFGAATVSKLLTKFAEGTGPTRYAFRMLNGLPAALGQARGRARWARRFVMRIEVREGLISEVQVILATAKLTAVRFDPA